MRQSLAIWTRLTSNSPSSCLSFPRARITSTGYFTCKHSPPSFQNSLSPKGRRAQKTDSPHLDFSVVTLVIRGVSLKIWGLKAPGLRNLTRIFFLCGMHSDLSSPLIREISKQSPEGLLGPYPPKPPASYLLSLKTRWGCFPRS